MSRIYSHPEVQIFKFESSGLAAAICEASDYIEELIEKYGSEHYWENVAHNVTYRRDSDGHHYFVFPPEPYHLLEN